MAMGVAVDKRKDGRTDFVPAEYIDGKYIKTCECGCGQRFEVPSRSRGTTRYHPDCAVEIRRKQMNRPGKTCVTCGEKKDYDMFPPNERSSGKLCFDCWPFDNNWTKYAPACFRKRKNGEAKYYELCPLYMNCMSRRKRDLYLPCSVPSKDDLLFALRQDDYEDVVKPMLVPGFDPDCNVMDRGVDHYIARLEARGDKKEFA